MHEGFFVECHCGKQFKHKEALKTHVKIVHLKLKSHTCDDCGRSFYGKTALSDHKKRLHSENLTYDFACEQCGKQFCTKRQLVIHKRTHLEAKFKCNADGCDKAYITKSKLERHLKKHIGKRDLLCHLCDKAYFFQRDLSRHLDVAHKQVRMKMD